METKPRSELTFAVNHAPNIESEAGLAPKHQLILFMLIVLFFSLYIGNFTNKQTSI